MDSHPDAYVLVRAAFRPTFAGRRFSIRARQTNPLFAYPFVDGRSQSQPLALARSLRA